MRYKRTGLTILDEGEEWDEKKNNKLTLFFPIHCTIEKISIENSK